MLVQRHGDRDGSAGGVTGAGFTHTVHSERRQRFPPRKTALDVRVKGGRGRRPGTAPSEHAATGPARPSLGGLTGSWPTEAQGHAGGELIAQIPRGSSSEDCPQAPVQSFKSLKL